MRTFLVLLVIVLASIASSQTLPSSKTISTWKYELPEEIKKIKPIDEGSLLFLWADEYAWLYETTTGKKVGSIKIDDYSEKALHELVYDSLYLVANEDTMLCYDIRKNVLLWKKKYPTIEQDRFSGLQVHDTTAVLSFQEIDLGINLLTGKELWRSAIEYQADLKTNGTVNSFLLPAQQKYVVFTADDEMVLASFGSGKRIYTRQKSEPHAELIKQKRQWYYVAPDEKNLLVVLDGGVLVLNTESGKERGFYPLDINEQYNTIIPTPVGCMVIGSEKILHCNFVNGIKGEFAADIDDIRNVVTATVDSGLVAIVSMEDKLLGFNPATGKVMWQTPEKFPPAKGFLHRFVGTQGNAVIVTYLDPSDDLKLSVMSIGALTGKINYRTLVAHGDESLPDRKIPLPATSAIATFGFDDAGFEYSVTTDGAKVHVLVHTASDMIEPNTTEEGGEGYAIVDIPSGKVEKKLYMKIAYGLSFKGGFTSLARPLTVGSLKILPGNKNLVAIDTTDASLKWMLIEQDVNNTCITDMAIVDSLLLLRTGGSKTEYQFDEKKKKMTAKKIWEEDDYALIAVDVNSGKVYWKKEFDDNPAALFPGSALSRSIVNNTLLLYGTEKFLYAQALQRKKADSLRWRFEFADSGVGSFSYDGLFNPASFWQNERIDRNDKNGYSADANVTFGTTEIAGEHYSTGVSRVLQVNYDRSTQTLVAIGEDGIVSINPETGRKKWLREWSYSDDAVQHRPVFLKDQLFYFVDGKAELLNVKTGRFTYGIKAEKESGVFIMPNASCVVLIYKDEVTGLIVP